MICGIGYFSFKLYRIYDPSQSSKYNGTSRFLTFFASLSLIMFVGTIFVVWRCVCNFGQGLKAHLMPDEEEPREVDRQFTAFELS
jgi:hypothetical protein